MSSIVFILIKGHRDSGSPHLGLTWLVAVEKRERERQTDRQTDRDRDRDREREVEEKNNVNDERPCIISLVTGNELLDSYRFFGANTKKKKKKKKKKK